MRRMIVEVGLVSALVVGSSLLFNQQSTEVQHTVEVFVVEIQQLRGQVLALSDRVEHLQQIIMYNTGIPIKFTEREMTCLAKNIYHEAGVEDRSGKIAVAQITYNRLQSGHWGHDLCAVVYARAQFSWTLSPHKKIERPQGQLWQESCQAAEDFVRGLRIKNLERSTHYHADYIAPPRWAVSDRQVHRIGQHIFYALL